MNNPVTTAMPRRPEECATHDQRERMLREMAAASHEFYRRAMLIGCHPFIEFTGLMNEYIKIARRAHLDGIDFSNCHKHSGVGLPMVDFERAYLFEKLDCIYGGSFADAAKHHLNAPDDGAP
jgi:hypothetical protein